jgi:hypothetical protein
MIQEELISLLTAAGITPDTTGTAFTQVLQAIRAIGRIKLTANLQLYVATTGSDANNGLSVGTPFATLQKAWDTIIKLYDLGGFAVTVNIANGTYTAGVVCDGVPLGSTGALPNAPNNPGVSVTFLGNVATPSAVVVSVSNSNCFQASCAAQIQVAGVRLIATGTPTLYNQEGVGLYAAFSGGISFHNVDFGACGTAHIMAVASSVVEAAGLGVAYSISGGSPSHMVASSGSYITIAGSVVTLTGTPGFASAFAGAGQCGVIHAVSVTFSGAATGPRYGASMNGVIETAGGGVSYFPGNSVGTTGTGAQYE